MGSIVHQARPGFRAVAGPVGGDDGEREAVGRKVSGGGLAQIFRRDGAEGGECRLGVGCLAEECLRGGPSGRGAVEAKAEAPAEIIARAPQLGRADGLFDNPADLWQPAAT